ncbi:MAG TPA: hypothetical protein VGG87_07415, partial [Solirubrobacteraceae bacterium]
ARHALAPSPLPVALLALAAAAVTLLLPRIGWLALTAAVAVTAVAQGHPGLALLLVPAALTAVVLVPWRATAWPLPAGAVALGLIGLAGAWPAMAGWASSAWRRAALAAAGWVWLLVAASITGHGLYLDWVPATSAADWSGSFRGTVDVVITPLLSAGVLAPAVVWALAACVLPWLVRGRSLLLDAILVVIWSATVVAASTAVIEAVHRGSATSTAPAAVVGAIVGAVVALGRAWQPQPGTLLHRFTGPFRAAGAASGADSGVGRQFP